MNKQQVMDLASKIVAIAGGYAVGHGWVTADQVVMIGGVVAAVIPLVWSIVANTQKAQVAKVEAMPGVTKILTNKDATPTLQAMADDEVNHPKVEPAK